MTKITLPATVLSQATDLFSNFKGKIAASYSREEAWAHLWMAVVFLTAAILLGINYLFLHFTVLPLFLGLFTTLPLVFLLWWFIGHIHRANWPRFGLLAIAFANVGFAFITFVVAWASIVTTPFVIIDYHLAQWDSYLGFNILDLMNWAHQYPRLISVLSFSYFSWEYQVPLAPLLLALLKKPKEINRYLIASGICFLIMMMIYYFFPTIAPAGIMHSQYFNDTHYNLVTRYYEIHQSLPISVISSGIISFPSGHVIYALLVLVALRSVKIVFYPMLVINFFLIIATMALGYHYLVDVIASFVIVAAVLAGMHFWSNQSRGCKKS
jgi:membrane-associated phospholipid phosphatase